MLLAFLVALPACKGPPSPSDLCSHRAGITGNTTASCEAELKALRAGIGEEKYARFARCTMKATSKDGLVACGRHMVTAEQLADYRKNQNTIEGRVGVRKIYDRVRRLVEEGRLLPESAGPTPRLGTCCESEGVCPPNPGLWQEPTWQALDFDVAVAQPFSFEYRRAESGDGSQTFTALAYGDLDCDGAYSTFRIEAEVPPGARSLPLRPELDKIDKLE
jgi:hypothetical protein